MLTARKDLFTQIVPSGRRRSPGKREKLQLARSSKRMLVLSALPGSSVTRMIKIVTIRTLKQAMKRLSSRTSIEVQLAQR